MDMNKILQNFEDAATGEYTPSQQESSDMKMILESFYDVAAQDAGESKSQQLDEIASVTMSGDSADEVAQLVKMMNDAGAPEAAPVGPQPTTMPAAVDVAADGPPDMPSKDSMVTPKMMDDFEKEEEPVAEDDWDNAPDVKYDDHKKMTHDLSGGLNRKKNSYADAEDGDNPMAVESSLAEELSSMLRKKMNEKDTSKKYSKGDQVKVKGKKTKVTVPDGPADLVGVDKNGKTDMVKSSKVRKTNEAVDSNGKMVQALAKLFVKNGFISTFVNDGENVQTLLDYADDPAARKLASVFSRLEPQQQDQVADAVVDAMVDIHGDPYDFLDEPGELSMYDSEEIKQAMSNRTKESLEEDDDDDDDDDEDDDGPCWKGYKMVGTKKKGGKEVPNCVPNEGIEEARPDSNFKLEDIAKLENMDLESAKQHASDMMQNAKTMKPEKVEYFQRQIENAPSLKEILSIMWNLYMSGEGLGTIGTSRSTKKSSYRQQFEAKSQTRNLVAKNAPSSGAGAHVSKKDKTGRKAKHKKDQIPMESAPVFDRYVKPVLNKTPKQMVEFYDREARTIINRLSRERRSLAEANADTKMHDVVIGRLRENLDVVSDSKKN